jgi:hypothetical protein
VNRLADFCKPESAYMRHRVRRSWKEWENIGASGQVLQSIREGVTIPFRHNRPPSPTIQPRRFIIRRNTGATRVCRRGTSHLRRDKSVGMSGVSKAIPGPALRRGVSCLSLLCTIRGNASDDTRNASPYRSYLKKCQVVLTRTSHLSRMVLARRAYVLKYSSY